MVQVISHEQTTKHDSTLSSFAIDAHPSSLKIYALLSKQTPAQTLYFSSSASNIEFATQLLQQALLGQSGGYMAMASAIPLPQDHHFVMVWTLKSQRLNMDLSAGGFSKS